MNSKQFAVPEGVLLLAQDGMSTTEQHHFDGGEPCTCSICLEKKGFTPKLILLPN